MGLMAVPDYTPANVTQSLPLLNLSNFLQPALPNPTSTLGSPQSTIIIIPSSTSKGFIYTNNMVIDAWAEAARRSHQGVEQQGAIDTLRTVFEGKESPDGAASTIASIYEPLLQRGFKIAPVTQLWSLVCDAVKALGGNQEIDRRLVDLLNSISKLPDVIDKHGNPITGGEMENYKVYWKDLPGLAIIFREYAMDIEPESSEMPDEGDWTDAQRAKLMSVTTFGALYLAHGRQPIYMSFHAEVGLMEGVEVPYQTPEQQRRAPTNVPPAATWILLAGEKIHELCQNSHDRKDDQGRGYSLERWALWKKRFGEIGNIQGLTAGVKDIASKAVVEMNRIEG